MWFSLLNRFKVVCLPPGFARKDKESWVYLCTIYSSCLHSDGVNHSTVDPQTLLKKRAAPSSPEALHPPTKKPKIQQRDTLFATGYPLSILYAVRNLDLQSSQQTTSPPNLKVPVEANTTTSIASAAANLC